MSSQMSSHENLPKLLTERFAGQRGVAFTNWSKAFLDAAVGKNDEDASWAECLLGTGSHNRHKRVLGLSAAQNRRRSAALNPRLGVRHSTQKPRDDATSASRPYFPCSHTFSRPVTVQAGDTERLTLFPPPEITLSRGPVGLLGLSPNRRTPCGRCRVPRQRSYVHLR